MYLFFGKNQVRARAELRRCTQQAESELSLPCFQNFFFVSSVFHALAAAHELSSFAKWPRMLEHQPQWLPQALEISSEALCARSLLLAELSSFANYHVISVRTKPAARRALLFCKLPRIILQYHLICARKACCLQSSPLSASYTNHTFFRRTELWKPFVAEPQKQSMNSLPSGEKRLDSAFEVSTKLWKTMVDLVKCDDMRNVFVLTLSVSASIQSIERSSLSHGRKHNSF